ncbi:NADP-dependent oxidoreductase [Sphingomonas aerophila]|jgi:NADPH:quinone reductase-like Zn-dependent oxidoreductase|uniref:NADPH:quinone reductase-like Zn-dependent oxidoreductase n=1 Tax=Sphingomonas aerophila TaxID=1344948 RepID=A0A7W9EUR1_9SPHN|nr:NADP-dependent oxidoreductase [Sphingomonas aerophila]MBB5715461.1 NADPH:quinone reductase-like Zn-dependent oxidoreductase [Sphingomonas aerophila]
MTDAADQTLSDDDTAALSVVLSRFGGADALSVQRMPIPQPQDDEVLVRVRAASVNPVDYKIAQGKFPPIGEDKLPLILGRDLAGTVEAMGTRAHYMVRHGDRVMAHIGIDRGAQSEFVVAKAVEFIAIPEGVDFPEAAGAGLASMTAWQGLFDQGGLDNGQTVLIHGAAGGVGHLAVQFAKWKGARVIATASAKDVDFVRSLGADTVIDYKAGRFEDQVSDVDLVLDLIGGDTGERSLAVLREGGILVSTVQPPSDDKKAGRDVRIAPRFMAQPNAAQLGQVADLMAAGNVRVTVARTFPITEAAAAYREQEEGHPSGKIVLLLD